MACKKPVSWKPFAGLLDNRSDPDLMPPYSFRYRMNWWATEKNKCQRLPGFEKLFSNGSYNNEDLHDQLLDLQTYYEDDGDPNTSDETVADWPSDLCSGPILTRTTGRQPISFLFKATSTFGSRALLAGTESRIYRMNNGTGNWKMIADGKGEGTSDGSCPSRRFRAAQLDDAVIFTNDYNKPFYWLFDQLTTGCGMQAVQDLPDIDTIGLTRAKHVWQFRKVVFLANVEMDGQRYANRIVWSNYDTLEFDPSNTASIAGFQDLDPGEEILGGAEINNEFLIYTNRGIWQMSAVGGERVFDFIRRYTPEGEGEGCLYYPNTLVSTGGTHIYLGRDGLYAYNLYTPAPELVEWVDLGTGDCFSNINTECCESHVAVYEPDRKLYMVSYAEQVNHCCPTKSMLVFMNRRFVSYMDHGFTAFCMFERESRETIREWMVDNCVCHPSQLAGVGFDYIKEGLPTAENAGSCQDIDAIYTNDALVTGASMVDLYQIEDYTVESFEDTSLCSALDGETIEDECDDCQLPPTLIAASVEDFCLKQMWTAYSREICTNPFHKGMFTEDGYLSAVGQYDLQSYTSVLRSGAIGNDGPVDNVLRRFELDLQTETELSPPDISLRTGQASQAVDPNEAHCVIVWNDEGSKTLECLATDTAANLAANNLRPDEYFGWNTWSVGRYLYFELTIAGTGGVASLTGANLWVEERERKIRG